MTPARARGVDDGAGTPTIAAARRTMAAQLRAAGLDSPELDARILVGHALRLDHAALAAASARVLTGNEADAIAALARRRLGREPVARIVGRKEFWGLDLAVDAATLIPRPETETVIEAALAAIDAGGPRARALRIADLGTGSGALALALLTELPNAFAVATDIAPAALAAARANAARLHLTRVAVVAGDLAAPLAGPFDLIVANPPYIASGEIAALAPEVRDFDPRVALDGGPDGLDYYRRIAATVPGLLASGGFVVVELGAGQAATVATLFAAAGLAVWPPHTDLNNVCRALLAGKPAPGGRRHEREALEPRKIAAKKALGIFAGTD